MSVPYFPIHAVDIWTPTQSLTGSKVNTSTYSKTSSAVIGELQPMTTPDKIRAGLDVTVNFAALKLPSTLASVPDRAVFAIKRYVNGAVSGSYSYWQSSSPANENTDPSTGALWFWSVLLQEMTNEEAATLVLAG